ncbi:MAG: prolyl oligopeptidase family serine peptidase [Alphaproteobacteria bacterium]|nr:prolyl oligopeptidase family serine peptidase [Alphaproteobacteria bacterium]
MRLRRTLAAMAVAILGSVGTVGVAAATPQTKPIPLEAMAADPALSQMQLSPTGEYIAAIVGQPGADPVVSVWRTDALSAPPKRIAIGGAAARKKVRFAQFFWVADDRIMMIARQPLTTGAGAESKGYTAIAFIANPDGSNWIEPLASRPKSELEAFANKFLRIGVLDLLPNDKRNILVTNSTLDGEYVYKLDVYTGRGEKVMQVAEDEDILGVVDAEGRPRVKQFAELRDGDWTIGYRILDPATGAWNEHPALSFKARQRRLVSIQAFDPENPDLLIVTDNENANLPVVKGYSLSKRAFVETMFSHPKYEAAGPLIDVDAQGAPKKIVGFTYLADVPRPVFSDPAYDALYKTLSAKFPTQQISIGPKRGKHRIVVTESSRHPPGYWLLTNDTSLASLGPSRPGIDPNTLADTQLVYYKARDGLEIPAFLTLPKGWTKGDAPLPVIIQPHGGPWSRNTADWGGGDIPVTQYFASRGFAVLQPQFRGSEGFGDKLWKAGDEQWGLAMQDDKDDGLKWLVDQGIADPKRAVMYGFSYGGFAAFAAVVRPNPPYRCAISGAGVSSLQRLGTLWSDNPVQRRYQGWTLKGMDPLENVEKASIPILIYHGDRDQTATIWHSERFAAALKAAGKPHEFVVISDMAHGASTPDMARQEFTIVENYLKGPCGISY